MEKLVLQVQEKKMIFDLMLVSRDCADLLYVYYVFVQVCAR